ncbi:E3 ubiquitin-protein ligase TRIM39-like [Rana temporaria]|uniref:E3 ubiquitin-protein ligase TRIM39-like n=1 Tax=Rana temporaria TaxID=8407 RepID=UPI001AADB71D|nr:E3 ubiquitin-protein ligase TRIM39-like [Rana temporaria]
MAFSDARKELDCSICLNIYTNPVTLRCGHNFCRECIEGVLDTQGGSGIYCCPECRGESQERPELIRNITLRNIMESFRSTEPEKEEKESQIFCTQCIHSPVIAVKSCLHCEASLCDDHLRIHSKSPQHVLSDLTTPQKNRKCSVHEKILEYYCTEDSACLCGSCRLHGDHQEHQVEALEEASEKRKENLTNALQELVKKREEMEESIKSLQKYKRKVQDSADGVTKRVTAIFRDIRRQLDILKRRVLKEITRKAERVSFPASDLIQDLEIKKDDLSREIRHIEEICNMADPLTFLQESDTGDLCDTEDEDEEDKNRCDKLLHGGGELDVTGISHLLYTGLSDLITGVYRGIYIPEPADILLDADTAHNYLNISDDRKTAHRINRKFNHPHTPERFQVYQVVSKTRYDSYLGKDIPSEYREVISPQVMSSQSFSSGRHYWDVDVGGSSQWRVGMCYPSIARTGEASEIGYNEKSWCLERNGDKLFVTHKNKSNNILANIPIHRVRVYLDYKAERLSFYKLDIPIQHLHTFTDFFNESLHAVVYVGAGCIKIGGGEGDRTCDKCA